VQPVRAVPDHLRLNTHCRISLSVLYIDICSNIILVLQDFFIRTRQSEALGHFPLIDRNFRGQHEAKAECADEVERMKLTGLPDPDDVLYDFPYHGPTRQRAIEGWRRHQGEMPSGAFSLSPSIRYSASKP
jgi:hypothetical protein